MGWELSPTPTRTISRACGSKGRESLASGLSRTEKPPSLSKRNGPTVLLVAPPPPPPVLFPPRNRRFPAPFLPFTFHLLAFPCHLSPLSDFNFLPSSRLPLSYHLAFSYSPLSSFPPLSPFFLLLFSRFLFLSIALCIFFHLSRPLW